MTDTSVSPNFLSFKLSEEFIEPYKTKEVQWGYKDAGGVSLGEITFLRTYSRLKEDGTKEQWWEVCRRVIEGMFSIQKDWCKKNKLPWNANKAQTTAHDAFDRMFNFKWTPAGRGLWTTGTEVVHKNGDSTASQNCAFVSFNDMTKKDPSYPFCFVMDTAFWGLGTGYDLKGTDKNFVIYNPLGTSEFVVPDSREGWVESLKVLLEAYLLPRKPMPMFDYSLIRPEGAPIKTFGGVAPGSKPLEKLHNRVNAILNDGVGGILTTRMIADICNLIGVAVVSGGVRRCLPEGTRINTTRGSVPIESLTTDDTVTTVLGNAKISDLFDQGVQETILIKHSLGEFECTPSHKVAVYNDLNSWSFKEAQHLCNSDHLVWDYKGVSEGVITALPTNHIDKTLLVDGSYKGSTRKPMSERHPNVPCSVVDCSATGSTVLNPTPLCNTHYIRKRKYGNVLHITPRRDGWLVPSLDEDFAWFVGMMQGDGCVYVNNTRSKGVISVACAPDHTEVSERVYNYMSQWGHIKINGPTDTDRGIKYAMSNVQCADWFYANVKQPKTTLTIPEWIWSAPSSVRASYISGLFDADGSCKTSPLNIATTVYRSYAVELTKLLASLGVPAKVKQIRQDNGWQPTYNVQIIGTEGYYQAASVVLKYSNKFQVKKYNGCVKGFGFNSEFGRTHHLPKQQSKRKSYSINELMQLGVDFNGAYPLPVIGVESSGRSVQTYDIEVEGLHQFTADGLVVHNSSQLMMGQINDEQFLSLKDYNSIGAERSEFAWASNNSVEAKIGDDLSNIIERIQDNGEPGVVWLDVAQQYGRLEDPADNKDWRARGFNPCVEQVLESSETCNLVESYIDNHCDLEDYLKTLKVAYLYGKTMTLLPTRWERTNAIMQRNRRIGMSMSGVANFYDTNGAIELRRWQDTGYKYLRELDEQYSEWMCVRESIRISTVKPAGTTSLLSGSSPGVHWTPGGEYFNRAIRFEKNDPQVQLFRNAGYTVEDDVANPDFTVVVYFPIHSKSKRSERDVSIYEKIALAASAQRYWSDNSVSVTVSFDPNTERDAVGTVLGMYDGQLKSVSFLPMLDQGAYPQMPYTQISEQEYKTQELRLWPVDLSSVYNGGASDAEGESYCSNDSCLLPQPTKEQS